MATDFERRHQTFSTRTSDGMTRWLYDLKRDPAMLLGARTSSPRNGFYRLLTVARSVAIDDGELTGNGHRWRWLVVNGDHIGRRASWPALERLAHKMASADPSTWNALKGAEMDREDRMERRRRAL